MAWRTLSDLTRQWLAARTVRLEAQATPRAVEVTATAPFATDVLTVSVPMPWPLTEGPDVQINGRPAAPATDAAALEAGAWLMRGSVITVSLPLRANAPEKITIERAPAH